jgi:hypothetical protein
VDRTAVITLSYVFQYFNNNGAPEKLKVTAQFTDKEIGTQGPGEFGKWIFERLNTKQPEIILIDDKPVNLDRESLSRSLCN